MTFTFSGTRAELVERIEAGAADEGRDIYVVDQFPDRIDIGFERQGHNGGRFFYAAVSEENGVLTLTGEPEDSYRHNMSKPKRLWDTFCTWAGGFFLLAFMALILWVVADDLGVSVIPFRIILLIPVIWICIRIPMSRKEQKQTDDEFYAFLVRTLAS